MLPGEKRPGVMFALGVTGVIVVGLIVLGGAYQVLASARGKALNPPPGSLVDIGGYKMHIDCLGTGSPTIVLDSGLGDTWLTWYKVQPRIAQFTRVCSYDRAGMGWSDASPEPRTSEVMAKELQTLLRKADVHGPYLMVGHSFGGFNVRLFRDLFPGEVIGMVLIDATHPDQYARLPPELEKLNSDFLHKEQLRRSLTPVGITRLMGWCGTGPAEIHSMLRTVDCRMQPWREHLAEWNAWSTSASQVRSCKSLGNLPLVVISHDPTLGISTEFERNMNVAWSEMQDELTGLSGRGEHIVARGSGHMIQIERPDIVVSSLKKMVDELRAEEVLANTDATKKSE